MAATATLNNLKQGNKKALFLIIGVVVLVIGLLAGVYLIQNRVTLEQQADEYTHQIKCTVGDLPPGRTCTVTVPGSPDSPQTVDSSGGSHPEYFFKVKVEEDGEEYQCSISCDGVEACIALDSASCNVPEASPSPSPTATPTPGIPTDGTCEPPTPCGEGIGECRSDPENPENDYYCNEEGFCDNDIVCVDPSGTPTGTPSPSPSPTVTPTEGPTPTLPPGVTPSVTPSPTTTPSPTATPTPKLSVCEPPEPVVDLAISCTTGTCSWDAVTGAENYKVTVVDATSGDKIAAYDPYQTTSGTSVTFDPVQGNSYKCIVEAVNVCGEGQASSPYRESEICSTGSEPDPSPTDIIVVNNTPTTGPTEGPTSTPPPGTSPTSTPVPTLPVAGGFGENLAFGIAVAAAVGLMFAGVFVIK